MDDLDPFFQMGFAPTKKQTSDSSKIAAQLPLNAMMAPQPTHNDNHVYNSYQSNSYSNGPHSTLRSSPITQQSWDTPTYYPPVTSFQSSSFNPYHDARYQLTDAPYAPSAAQYDPFSFPSAPMITPPQAAPASVTNSYSQHPQSHQSPTPQTDMFDPFFSNSNVSQNHTAFDPFGTSAFSAPTTQPPQAVEDDFFTAFSTAPVTSSERELTPEEKMKEDLRKLREVYQLEDVAAVSSRSMDESDEDGWTPHYHGERNPTVTASNLNLPLEGRILARLSTRSLVTKDWDEAYWVISHGVLYVYRNESDYRYNPADTMVKKKVPITRKLVVNKVKRKEYDGVWLHNFMLQEETDFGLSNVAKFASTDRNEVDVLWLNLKTQITAVKKQNSRRQPTLM